VARIAIWRSRLCERVPLWWEAWKLEGGVSKVVALIDLLECISYSA